MKSLSVKLDVILIGLIVFGYVEVWATDWRLFDFDDEETDYYDAESVTRPFRNIVRVWIRSDFTEKGIIEKVKQLGKEYVDVEYAMSEEEIDCLDRKRRTLSVNVYSKGGKIIYSNSREGRWDYIPSGGMGEFLYKAVCKNFLVQAVDVSP